MPIIIQSDPGLGAAVAGWAGGAVGTTERKLREQAMFQDSLRYFADAVGETGRSLRDQRYATGARQADYAYRDAAAERDFGYRTDLGNQAFEQRRQLIDEERQYQSERDRAASSVYDSLLAPTPPPTPQPRMYGPPVDQGVAAPQAVPVQQEGPTPERARAALREAAGRGIDITHQRFRPLVDLAMRDAPPTVDQQLAERRIGVSEDRLALDRERLAAQATARPGGLTPQQALAQQQKEQFKQQYRAAVMGAPGAQHAAFFADSENAMSREWVQRYHTLVDDPSIPWQEREAKAVEIQHAGLSFDSKGRATKDPAVQAVAFAMFGAAARQRNEEQAAMQQQAAVQQPTAPPPAATQTQTADPAAAIADLWRRAIEEMPNATDEGRAAWIRQQLATGGQP